MESPVCRTINFPHKKIAFFPKRMEFVGSAPSLTVDYMREADRDELYKIVQECAKNDDNVGLDEYPSQEDFEDFMLVAFRFSIKDAVTGTLKGALCVRGNPFGRSRWPTVAALFLFLTHDLAKNANVQRDFFRLGESVILALDVGFTKSAVSLSVEWEETVLLLKKEGYNIFTLLPEALKTKRGYLIQVVYLQKELTDIPTTPYTKRAIDVMNKAILAEQYDKKYADMEQRKMPFLPVDYVLPDGTEVFLRNLRKEESVVYYNMIKDTIGRGDGFGADEFSSLEEFQLWFLSGAYVYLAELKSEPGKIVSFFAISDSSFTRSSERVSCDGSILVAPKYKGLKIGHEMSRLYFPIAKKLGYRSNMTDVVFINRVGRTVASNVGGIITGTLPSSVYVQDQGWQDTVVFHRKFDADPNFEETMQINAKRRKSPAGSKAKI